MDLLNRCCCILFFILFPTNIGMCILIALLQFSVITFDDIPGFGLPDPTPAAATTSATTAAITPKAPAKADTVPLGLGVACEGDLLKYCNSYPDLQEALCGGDKCKSEHEGKCKGHYWNYG